MYYIDNATRETVKALNIENKKALRGLSDNFCFDFEKPFFIVRLDGKFTFNSAKKAIPAEYVGNAALLIKKQENKYWRNDKLYLVQMGATKFYCGERYKRFTTWSYDLYDFSGVGDFEDARKTCTDHYYIIAQARDNARQPHNYNPDKLERHKLETANACSDGKGNKYYSSLTLRDASGQIWQYNMPGYYCGCNTVNPRAVQAYHNKPITDYIDKSGYILPACREDLARRLKKYKMAKAERVATMTDFDSAENIAINAIRDKRETIAKLLITPKTGDEINEIEKMLNKLRWVLWAWERYTAGKNEASATTKKRQIDNILADLNKIKFELYAGGVKNENIA